MNISQLVIPIKDGATNLDIAADLRFRAGLLEGLDPKVASSAENTDPFGVRKKKKAKHEDVEEIEDDEDDVGMADPDDDGAEDLEDDEESEDESDDEDESEDDEESEDEPEDEGDESDDEESEDESEDEEQPAKVAKKPVKEKPAKAKPVKGKSAKSPAKSPAKEPSKASVDGERKKVNLALKNLAQKTTFARAKAWLKKKFKVESINDLKPAQFETVIKLANQAARAG